MAYGFCGVDEVYLGGRWHTFDRATTLPDRGAFSSPTAACCDVPLTNIFGPAPYRAYRVWAEEADSNSILAA